MKRAVLLLAVLLSTYVFAATEAGRGPIRSASLDIANPNIQNRVHREGNVWLNVTNFGYFGNYGVAQDGAWGDPCPPGDWAPQGEYPGGSNQEYLFQGAVWIGALIQEGGEWVPRVSVGTDGWFNPSINELYPGEGEADGIIERSNISGRINCFGENVYDPATDANEEFIATYADTLTDDFWLVDDPVDGLHRPLSIEVTQRSMAWNSFDFDDFIVLEFTVRNLGADTLRSVYLGLYVDGDVGLWNETEHHADDITGFLAVDTLTGDTFNIAYIADNDGRLTNDPDGPLLLPHVSGMYVLATSQQDVKWSYNWWISNGDLSLDFGPAWEAYCARDSLGMGWTQIHGTPVGDLHKYHLLSNGEHDYDQIMVNRLDEVPPQHVIRPDGSEVDEPWCTLDLTPEAPDIADGYDTRYLMSCGPLGILDHVEPNGERIYRLDPGGEFTLTVAYVFGMYFHDPDNPQIPFQPIDPSKFDFTDLLHNARQAKFLWEQGYAYQPPSYPPVFYPTGVLDGAVPLAWHTPDVGTAQGYNIYGRDEDSTLVQFSTELVADTFFTVNNLINGSEWTLLAQTVDDSGIVSGYADTLVRVGAPLPVTGLEADLDSSVVHLSWNANADPALTNYRVLRRSNVLGDSLSWITTATAYTDDQTVVGRPYTYWVVAENSRGLLSFNGTPVMVIPWDPDRRILVIDETDSLRGADVFRGGVSQDSVALMYERLMTGTGQSYDIIHQPDHGPLIYSLEALAEYDVVVWHSENNRPPQFANPESLPDREQMLQTYVAAGGRLLRMSRRFLGGQLGMWDGVHGRDYIEEQFPYGNLLAPLTFDSVYVAGQSNAQWYPSVRLVGATAEDVAFPDVELDTARLHQMNFMNQHLDFLPEIDAFWPRPETYPLYRAVVHDSDTSEFENQPVAVMGYGEILLGFPLYFLHEEDAQAVLNASLEALRAYTDIPEPPPTPPIPTTLALAQNYPNPFNAATTLKFDLPEAMRVQLVIYNLLGQQVRVLIDQPMQAGYHTIRWDGSSSLGTMLPSGLYLARLETAAASRVVKVVLLR